jgi:hypothetical protein
MSVRTGKLEQAEGTGEENIQRDAESAADLQDQPMHTSNQSTNRSAIAAAGPGVSSEPGTPKNGERVELSAALDIRFISLPKPDNGRVTAVTNGPSAELDEWSVLEDPPATYVIQTSGTTGDTRYFNDLHPALRPYVAAYMKKRIDTK